MGTGEAGAKKPVIIMGVAKKVDAKKKGELMEQNQDALEYSSEEEGEDLKDTMASINSKGKKVRGLIGVIIVRGALEIIWKWVKVWKRSLCWQNAF